MNLGRQAIVLALLLVTAAWAGGEWPPQGEDDPKIEVREKPITARAHENTFDVSVVIAEHAPITIGQHEVQGEQSWQQRGVDATSVRVRRLNGTPELYLIEWLDFMQGNGNYRSYFYQVRGIGDPGKILISGSTMLSGKAGWRAYGTGRCEIRYDENQLTVTESRWRVDTATEPKPLHHFVPDKGDFYQANLHTRITRAFEIIDGQVKLTDARFAYKVQKGDRCEDVIMVFKLDASWLSDEKLPDAGEWVTARIPLETAEQRWPTQGLDLK